jgi:hypothetical protein
MTTRVRFFVAAMWLLTVLGGGALAQAPSVKPPLGVPGDAPADTLAQEAALLRRALQTLNTRLREISEKLLTANLRAGGAADESQKRIANSLDLLSRAEQRAAVLRQQLLELTEKETGFRTRLANIEDDMRPDSIDRSIAIVGSTRTPEVRELRRRVLDNERRGVEALLNQTAAARARLEEDVKDADLLVFKLRQRVLPLIEKEIDKIDPSQP